MFKKEEIQVLVESVTSSYLKYPLSEKKWFKAIYIMNIAGGLGLFYHLDDENDIKKAQPLVTQRSSSGIGFDNDNLVIKIFTDYRKSCQSDPNLRWNKGTFTIYPNGEYESSFIWDEAGHLGKLVRDVESWFSYVGIKAGERVEDKYPELCNIDFNFSMELILSFTNGVSNPALFMKKNQPELTFSLYMEQLVHYIENDYLEAFEEYAKIRKIDSEAVKKDTAYYLMMNEGELKGRYPRWNVARLTVGPQLGFLNFQDVIFEWREDLA